MRTAASHSRAFHSAHDRRERTADVVAIHTLTLPMRHIGSSRRVIDKLRVKHPALHFASAHDALACKRAARLGDDGVLALDVLVVMEVQDHPVPRAAELVRTRGV